MLKRSGKYQFLLFLPKLPFCHSWQKAFVSFYKIYYRFTQSLIQLHTPRFYSTEFHLLSLIVHSYKFTLTFIFNVNLCSVLFNNRLLSFDALTGSICYGPQQLSVLSHFCKQNKNGTEWNRILRNSLYKFNLTDNFSHK